MAAAEIILTNGATPATPGAGKTKLFVNAAKQLTVLDDAGNAAPVFGTASYMGTPSNPTGTTNTTGLMAGLAGAITPVATGRILVTVTGNMSNSSGTIGNGAGAQIRYGTGSAPANAAALTGTTAGAAVTSVLERAVADAQPFCLTAMITGLAIGTAVWLDLMERAVAGGTGVLTNISISIIEF